jgi:3-methylcrotonyl-CoA carboxylase beta subunit
LKSNTVINTEFLQNISKVVNCATEKDIKKMAERGKLTVRERIDKVVDRGAPFIEFSQLAGWELYEEDFVPACGIVTGVGLVKGRPCAIVANDPNVKGGSYYPITVNKHARAQEIAIEYKLPCIYLGDSEQHECHENPPISAVLGSCTAGGAYVPAMSDENVIVSGNGTIFLAGPPLIKAATGEDVSAEELGGGVVHSMISGVTDHLASNEVEALCKVREIVARLGSKKEFKMDLDAPAPLHHMEELDALMPSDLKQNIHPHHLISRLVDKSEFHEFKENYGTSLIAGFAKLYGNDVGITANNGVLFSEAALKEAHFIELCTQRSFPLQGRKRYESEGIA